MSTKLQHLAIRFLIGLTDRDGYPVDEKFQTLAQATLAGEYGALGVYYGIGYWRGTAEQCMMAETVLRADPHIDDRNKARRIARELADKLNQEGIGLVFTPCEFEVVEP